MFAGADGILKLRYALAASEIERIGKCRVIARYGIGFDNVDVEAATAHRIYVTNVPATA